MAKKQQEQPIKINSFFAGIGGFDLGFERQGFRTMMLCENDPFCNRILNRHWPDVQKELDIRNVAAEDIPEAPVWCGGFPCQDISVARGKNERLGLQGERSGLFYDYARLIEQCHPEVVMIENVEGLFSSNQGRDFRKDKAWTCCHPKSSYGPTLCQDNALSWAWLWHNSCYEKWCAHRSV